MSKIGKKFPEFDLETYYPVTEKIKKITNKEFLKKWLIVFYYPADFTFVCPTELKDMASQYDNIKKFNCEVIAVSTDTVFTHKAWIDTEKLLEDVKYPLAADHDGELAKSLGIYNMGSGVADRGIYIIDPDGILQSYEVVADNIGRSASEILRKLKALDHVRRHPNHACPASWDTGQKDLKPDIKIAGKVFEALEE